MDEREAGRVKVGKASLLWMSGKRQGERNEGQTLVDKREAGRVKGKKPRYLWKIGKLAG